jgi:hypothetical protein
MHPHDVAGRNLRSEFKTISDHIVGPRAGMYVHGINTGFILENEQRINCRVVQFAKYSIGLSPPAAKNTTPPTTSSVPPSDQRAADDASPNAQSPKFLAMSATAQLAFWTSYCKTRCVRPTEVSPSTMHVF